MRQLDLFGSLIDTPPQKDETGEKPTDAIKKELTAAIPNEEVPYSLVELAEEMLGASTFENSPRSFKTAIQDAETADQPEQKNAFSFSDPNTSSEISATITVIEKSVLQLSADNTDLRNDITETKSNGPKANQFEESEEMMFEDEKLAGKIKSKVAGSADTGRLKKEPQKRGRKSLEEIEADVDLIEIPEDEELFKKQYYSISEVAKWFRVNTSLLRFWEKEFDILKPRKNRKGDRLFRPEDIKNLQLIYHLLRQRKYTIEGAREYIKTNRRKADIQLQLTTTLQKFKSFLLDLKTNL